MGKYNLLQLPVLIFEVNIIATSLCMLGILSYSNRSGLLVVPEQEERVTARTRSRWRTGPMFYFITIWSSFIGPLISFAAYIAILIFMVVQSIFWLQTTRSTREFGKTSGIVARLISMSRDELHGEAEDRRLRTRTLRLAVLSYLTIVLFLWMARILAVSGIISLPLGFSAVGAQANLVTGILFLALGPGILGMRELNRRQKLESVKPRSDTNRAK